MQRGMTFRLSVLFMIVAAIAAADDLTWAGQNGLSWGGFYTSPYSATDNTLNSSVTRFCLDFNHEINPPSNWQADFNALNAGNVSKYQYSGSYGHGVTGYAFTGDNLGAVTTDTDRYRRYLEAAYLFTNIQKAQLANPTDANTMIVSQVAAWLLFVDAAHDAPGTGLEANVAGTTGNWSVQDYVAANDVSINTGLASVSFQNAVDSAVKAAQNEVVNDGWVSANWQVVTGNYAANGAVVQEFLAPVPEPAAILRLGTLIGFTALVVRRRPDMRQKR
jgi:hypothetical protein